MKKILLALAFVSQVAFAVQGGEGDNTGCNGVGNPNSPCGGTTVVNPQGGSGGAGGNGGAGGVGYGGGGGTGIGVGGNSSATGGSGGFGYANATNNQGQQSTNTNANQNNVTVTDIVSSDSKSSAKASSANRNDNQSAASSGSVSQGNTSGNVNITGDQYQKNPVSTAVAPLIVTGSDQCLVAITGSVQAMSIGVAMGSAVPDKTCEVMKLSDRLHRLGQVEAAVKILELADERVAAALKAVQK